MNGPPTFTIATADAPGAIGIIQLTGPDAADRLGRWLGIRPDDRCRPVDIAGIDEGLVVALRDDWVQVMAHGGPRVMQRLSHALLEQGFTPSAQPDPQRLYPEADSDLEADMLWTLAQAASGAAVDWLLIQPECWRRAIRDKHLDRPSILAQSRRLDRLVQPPALAVVGRANVGKSTLSNLACGRSTSITADLPGTTRDWVGALAELPAPVGSLTVRWFDTPGLRRSDDPIEQDAIALAAGVLGSADLLIALADPLTDWPDDQALPRSVDLHVLNKADLPEAQNPSHHRPPDIAICALKGDGLKELSAAIAEKLGLADLDPARPWAFSQSLRRLVSDNDCKALARYAGL